MAADPNKCLQILQQVGLSPACDPSAYEVFREEQDQVFHQFCASSSNYYMPVQMVGCYNTVSHEWQYAAANEIVGMCLQMHAKDPAWTLKPCYLCCHYPAMPVRTADGTAAIGVLGAGDHVLVGSLENGKPVWTSAPLAFSQGLPAKDQYSPMIRLELGIGVDHRALSLPSDQVLLLADGTLTTADRLAPGLHLMAEDGQPVHVAAASVATGAGSAHFLTATTDFDGKLDGHLLSVSGIVIGDYTLQLHFAGLPATMKMAGYDKQAPVGSPEYAKQYPQSSSSGKLSAGASD